jgi:hypothetical protein
MPERPARDLPPEPSLEVPPWVLARHGARVLDPVTALRRPGEEAPRSTIYLQNRLVGQGHEASQRAAIPLKRAVRGLGLSMRAVTSGTSPRSLVTKARQAGAAEDVSLDNLGQHCWHFELDTDRPSRPADAWQALQAFRTEAAEDTDIGTVALDHLVGLTMPGIGGSPFTQSHGVGGAPFTQSHGGDSAIGSYAIAGSGGRAPVQWLGAAPTRQFRGRRPVVAILDTGIGKHDWLTAENVIRAPRLFGARIGLPPARSGVTGVSDPLTGLIDPDAGHGTFIAGLIRQTAPDAMLLDIPIFGGGGVVAESVLLAALQRLVIWHQLGVAGVPGYQPIDVVSLSLGYYHEHPLDLNYDALLKAPLEALVRSGVLVVVSAGNDATSRPMYPAAFSLTTPPDALPVISVGALNPDSTTALFSNDGDWVSTRRAGASLVSTYPVTVQAGANPAVSVRTTGGRVRASIDPDSFVSGFATWSGTSFAAPVLAGQLAAHLAAQYDESDAVLDPSAALTRARTAIRDVVTELRPVVKSPTGKSAGEKAS